jgi:diacylglycerol kinase family enzyme
MAHYARVRDQGTTQGDRVERYLARKIKIETTPEPDIMADGEMLGKGEVRIRMCPGALQVIAPQAAPR